MIDGLTWRTTKNEMEEIEIESHLTLAHWLLFLGFYLLVQGFPSKQ